MPNVNELTQRGLGLLNQTTRLAGRLAGRGAGQAFGVVQKAQAAARPPKDLDDVTLARKVESVAFRGRPELKGHVDVNAVDGVVSLHGELKTPAEITALEAAVRAIPEVRDVENLLHLPKTPAPSRADAPKRTRRRATSKTPRKTTRGRVTDDRTTDLVPDAEPTGEQLAKEGKGRRPAPLGSQGNLKSKRGEAVKESGSTAAAGTTGLSTGSNVKQ